MYSVVSITKKNFAHPLLVFHVINEKNLQEIYAFSNFKNIFGIVPNDLFVRIDKIHKWLLFETPRKLLTKLYDKRAVNMSRLV